MNWYLQNNNESDVVKSTKIRFVRNLKEFKFNLKEKYEIERLENKIKDNIYNIGYGLKFLKLKDMDEITKLSLVEKNLVSYRFIKNNNDIGSILINDEENMCIMIGGENHLTLQVFSAGLELENTLNFAIEIDEKIGEVLSYAVSKKYGYLTSCPSDIGTGMKASVIVHLPALIKTKNMKKVSDTIGNFGMNIKGVYEDNLYKQGEMYRIYNKQTIGITEKEIVNNIKVITQKLIEQERQARKLLANDELELEDIIYRSYGILTNCKKISYEETKEILSDIKLGVDMGILKELTDLKVQKLYLYTKSANLQKYMGEEYSEFEIPKKRAEIIKKIVNEK